jgi:hypothetical protein
MFTNLLFSVHKLSTPVYRKVTQYNAISQKMPDISVTQGAAISSTSGI